MLVSKVSEVEASFSKPSPLRTFLAGLSEECEYVIKALVAIGQGSFLLNRSHPSLDLTSHYRTLLDDLLAIEDFYKEVGGIVGYQCLALSLLVEEKEEVANVRLKPPERVDLTDENDPTVRSAILKGIWCQGRMAEFYPLGGTADRLELKDEKSGKELPAACLVFQGKRLLEKMIHDLQAREYLHYKLFGKQILTPLVLMTSKAENNHDHIRTICMENGWFNRPKTSFCFLTQPSVPVFTKKANWCLEKPMQLLLKPGGHGAIWKLAKEAKTFDWLTSLGKTKALVRQINNPIAAIDYGLLAFSGIGHEKDRSFGFASCERQVNASEGMIVKKEITSFEKQSAVITNIEYCDFKKYGIEDRFEGKENSPSLFPSNTNILFVDLLSLQKKVASLPLPGLLVNFRDGVHYTPKGQKIEKLARLETTMQNMADAFPFEEKVDLPSTYVTFNKREKTISTTKRQKSLKSEPFETPERCFYDLMQNAKEVLKKGCGIKFKDIEDRMGSSKEKKPFLMSYHPALGPLHSVIRQKIQGGEFLNGSELQLEIADLEIKNLRLDGSLLVIADRIMGHTDAQGTLHYSDRTGQCILKNVTIENGGIDWKGESHSAWKHQMKRKETFRIYLQGHSRFEAENVIFRGNFEIEVQEGVHMLAMQKEGRLVFEKRALSQSESFWLYKTKANHTICLSR